MTEQKPARLGNPSHYKPVFRIIVNIAGLAVALYATLSFPSNSAASYTVTNSFFATLLAFAAVCFSFARAISEPSIADRITFAGERFLHAAIIVIATTAIRYVSFKVTAAQSFEDMHVAVAVGVGIVLFCCWVVFGIGVVFASSGLRIISDVLNDRMFRHDDWDDAY